MADDLETSGTDDSSSDQSLQTLDALHLDGKGAPTLEDADERSLAEIGDTRPEDVTGNANVQSAGRTTFEQMVQGGIREQPVVPTGDNVVVDIANPTERDNNVNARFDNVQPTFTPGVDLPDPERRPERSEPATLAPDQLVTRDPVGDIRGDAEPEGNATGAPQAAAPVPDDQVEQPQVEPPATAPTDPDEVIPKVADAPSVLVAAASGTEDLKTRLDITIATADQDGGSETISSIIIGNVPTGFSFVDAAGNPVGVATGGGTWLFTQGQLGDLYLRQPENYSGDITLSVSATSRESNGSVATTTTSMNVHVEAVADAPDLSGSATGTEDQLIPVTITVGSNDAVLEGLGANAPETITGVTVSDVPPGFSFVTAAGVPAGVDSGNGSWSFTPAELADLYLKQPGNYSGDITLTVSATSQEANGSTATTTTTMGVHVDAVADAPDLAATGSGIEDQLVPLTITVGSNDAVLEGQGANAPETITGITVSNVPTGFSFATAADVPVGVNNGNGTWSFTPAQLADLHLKQPGNYSGELTLTVSATSREANGSTATTTTDMVVRVEAVADAPDLAVRDSAGMEDALIPLSITVGSNDAGNEGVGAYAAETQTVYIDRLPAGATLVDGATGQPLTTRLDSALVIGSTTIPAGSYVVSSAQLATLKVQSAPNDSHDFSLDVWATSTEPSNGSVAVTGFQTIAVDVGIVTPTVSGSASGTEGDWATLSLTGTVNHDLAGPQETLNVYIEGLPVGAEIRFADGSTPTATVVNGVTRYDVTGHLNDTQVRWTDGRSDTDMDLTVRGVVHDTDVSTTRETVLGDATAPDWNQSTANVHVTIQAVADGPSSLVASGIGVEDKWFDLNITTALADADSETLTVTVTGPAGFLLADASDTAQPYSGTLSADGTTITYTLTQSQLANLQMRAEADSDADIDLTITATGTETGPETSESGQVAVESASQTIALNVKILSDADKPVVSVIKDTQTISEDGLFDLSKSVTGTFNDGSFTHAAVTGAATEAGSDQGAPTSDDTSETITYRITANQASRISYDGGATSEEFPNGTTIEVSAADIASGKVQLGGPSDWASSAAHPTLTFTVVTVATEANDAADDALQGDLVREGVRFSDPAVLTIAVDPVADVSTARLAVVASGYEDGLSGYDHTAGATGAGIAVVPTLTLSDLDQSERPTGLVTITSDDPAMLAGSLTISGADIVRHDVTDGAGHVVSSTWTITGGDFTTTADNAFRLDGLVFHPPANSDADPTYDISVQFQDTNGGPTATVTAADQTITVIAVADKPLVAADAVQTWESDSGARIVDLDISATRGADTDDSESLYVYVTDLPSGAGSLIGDNVVTYTSGTVAGLTASGTNPVYRIPADDLDSLQLSIKQGYSTDVMLKVVSATIEQNGDDVAVSTPTTLRVDIGVFDPVITGSNPVSGKDDTYAVSGNEDARISLSSVAVADAAPGDQETRTVYVEAPTGVTLYDAANKALTRVTFTDANGDTHSGFNVTNNLNDNGSLNVSAKNDAANSDANFKLNVYAIVADSDADATADAGGIDLNTGYKSDYHDTAMSVATVEVTVNALVDKPNTPTLTAVGVEDKWVALNFSSAELKDTDGSEKLTVILSDVPDGMKVVSANGSVPITQVNATTWKIGPAASTEQMKGWLQDADLRLTDLDKVKEDSNQPFVIKVSATATEYSIDDAITPVSATSNVGSVTVTLYGDADKPGVDVLKGATAATAESVDEDGLYDFKHVIETYSGENADDVINSINEAYGATSADGSEILTLKITVYDECVVKVGDTVHTLAANGSVTVTAAQILAGEVSVGGVGNWSSLNADDLLRFDLTPVATETDANTATTALDNSNAVNDSDLTRTASAIGDTKSFYLYVKPLADETNIVVSAAGQEDSAGIPIAPTITLGDTDGSEDLTGTVDIMVACDADGTFPGTIAFNGTGMVDAGIQIYEGHAYHVFKIPVSALTGSAETSYTLNGLTFTPTPDSDLDIQYRVRVVTAEDGNTSTYTTVSSLANLDVAAVADAPILTVGANGATTDAAGEVTVHDFEDGGSDHIVRLDLGAQLKDRDGSEQLTNTELRNVPKGWGVVTVDEHGNQVSALVGTDADGDGTYTFVLDPAIFAADSTVTVALVPPANSDVDASDIVFWAKSTEVTGSAGHSATDDQVALATKESSVTLNVQLDPVADTPILNVTSARGSEDQSIALDIRASVTDLDESASVVITGVPSGGRLSYTAADGHTETVTFGNGITSLTCSATEARSLRFTAPEDASGKYSLTVTAISTDTDTENPAVSNSTARSATIDVVVKGVNDEILDQNGHVVNAASGDLTATGTEDANDNLVSLGLGSYSVTDVDHSESLSAVIQGLPDGVTLVVKTESGVVETSEYLQYIGKDSHGDPIWSVSPDYLKYVYVQVPNDYAGSFDLSVRLVTTEADGASTSFDKTLTVTVKPSADAPAGTVVGTYTEDQYGADGGIAFSLKASVGDGDLHSTLGDGTVESITGVSATVNVDALVARLPTGASTSGIYVTGSGGARYGVELVDGHYVIRLTGLSVTEGTSVTLSGFTLYGVPKDWSYDVPVTMQVTVNDDTGRDGVDVSTATFDVGSSIVLNPDPDRPDLDFVSSDPNHVYSAAGGSHAITIIANGGITTSDADGSENLANGTGNFYVVVDGVPKGVVVQGGINNGDGSWTLPTGVSKLVLEDYTASGTGTKTLTITTYVTDKDQNDGHLETKAFEETVSVKYGMGGGTGGGTELTMNAAVSGSLTTSEESPVDLGDLGIAVSGTAGYTFTVNSDGSVTGTNDTTHAQETVGTVSLVVQVPSGWSMSGTGVYLLGESGGVQTYTVPYSQRDNVNLTPPKDYAGTGVELNVRAVVTDSHGHYDTTDTDGQMTGVPVTVTSDTDGASITGTVGTATEDAASIPITLTVADKETQYFSETLASDTITVTIDMVKGADGNMHLPGTLKTGTIDGMVVSEVAGSPGTYTIKLTQSQIDAFTGGSHKFTIDDLEFVPAANFSGSVNISFSTQVQDTGTDAQGSTGTVSFTVTPDIDATTYGGTTASGQEDAAIALDLTINHQDLSGTGNWGSETVSVVISGVPEGAIIEGATNNGPTTVNGVTTYSWTVDRSSSHMVVTSQGVTLKDVNYVSPTDDSSDVQLTVTTYVFEKGVSEPKSSSTTITVGVDGVTDGVTLNPNNASGFEDVAVAIDLGAQLVDVTGSSEVVYVTLTGVPAGASFQDADGNEVGEETASGTWRFSIDEVDTLGLLEGGKLYLTGPRNVSGSWTLTAQAVALDTDGTTAVEVPSNALTFSVTLAAVADAPTLTVDSTVSVTEDGQESLGIHAGLVDLDSESLTVIITGAPDDTIIRVNTGTEAQPVWTDISGQDGVWTIPAGTATSLDGLYVKPPADYNGSFTLNVVATSTEKDGGSAWSPTDADGNVVPKVITVTVEAANDAPTTKVVSGGVGIEAGTHTGAIYLLAGTDSVSFDDSDFHDVGSTAVLSKMTVGISGGSGLNVHDSLGLSGVEVTLQTDGTLVCHPDADTTITIAYDPASHTLTFSGNATPAQYADLAKHVVISSTDGTLTAGTREVTITAYDTDGAASTAAPVSAVTVTVTGGATLSGAALGDVAFNASGAAVLPAGTIVTTEDAAPFALNLDMASALAAGVAVTIAGMPAGTIFRDALGDVVDAAHLTVGQLPGLTAELPDDWNGSATLTVTANAGGTILTEAVTVTASAVNDLPTTSMVALAGTSEGGSFTFTTAQLLAQAGDVDGDGLSVSGLSAAHGTITANGGGSYTYTPSTDYHGADVVTYTIGDGHGGTVAGRAAFTVASVNDAPTLGIDDTSTAVQASSGMVSSPIHVIDSGATIAATDVDGTISGMTVQLLADANGHYAAGDTLGLYGYDIALNTSCDVVIKDTDITVSYNSTDHTLTFSGTDDNVSYTDLAKSVVLSSTEATVATGTRSFRVTLYDDANAASQSVTTSVAVSNGAATSAGLSQDAHGTIYWDGGTPVLNGSDSDNTFQINVGADLSVNGNGGSDTLSVGYQNGGWTFEVDPTDHLVHMVSSDGAHEGIIHLDPGVAIQPFGEGGHDVVFNGSANGTITFDGETVVSFTNLEKIHG